MVETRHAMKSRRPQAAFFWQALLIAAPIVILSAVALFSLRLDQAAILQDARENAQPIVSDLVKQCGETFNKDWVNNVETQNFNLVKPENGQAPHRILQGMVVSRQILFPFDYPRLPTPPTWPDQITPPQLLLWQAAEEALFQKRDPVAVRNAMAEIKAAGLPEAAIANVELNLLLLEAGPKGKPDLAPRLTDMARRYRNIETAAGTPIADIALLQALLHTTPEFLPDLLAELSGRVESYPSFLTPELLDTAERVQPGQNIIRNEWRQAEETRHLLGAFIGHLAEAAGPGEYWFQSGGQWFLALCSQGFGRAIHVALIPAQWLEENFLSALGKSLRIPSYSGVLVQMGDRRWRPGMTRAPGWGINTDPTRVDLLASASGKVAVMERMELPLVAFNDNLRRVAPDVANEIKGWPPGKGIHDKFPLPMVIEHPFTVSLVLADPGLLYARHRQRVWLMAGFILLAATAAGFGLVNTWRAFQRQVRLAEMTANFVSSVSHELRAPLASVRLMAESLDQGRIPESEKQKGYFHLIVQECRRLSSLVENVLDFSRIRQGRKSYEFEPVDLAALVRQTVRLMTPAAQEHQVNLELADPAAQNDLQPCWDGQAVQQALVNLLDNAIKHSPAGAAVKIRWEAEEKQIRIIVEDQGPGIPEEDRKRIFEPFYRRGSELRRETKGIGIGLSIVQHVAEAHGGCVLVESRPGQGSRFILELPA